MIVAFELEQAFPVLMTSFNYKFQDFINSPFCPYKHIIFLTLKILLNQAIYSNFPRTLNLA